MSDNLQFFVGYSLVDITPTGVTRSNDPDCVERNQHRNWETVLQCISLRTQPLHIQKPELIRVEDIKNTDFGDFYEGSHSVWTWSWAVEHEEIYNMPNKPMGALLLDFEQVPVVTGLCETAKFMLPIFYPYGSIKNVYFEQAAYS